MDAAVPALAPPDSSAHRWLVAGVALLVLAVGVQYTLKSGEERSAFVRWRDQLHDLGEGKNIYRLHLYPNAPIMAIILFPLSHMPRVEAFGLDLDLGALAWFGLKVGMAILAFLWVRRIVREANVPFPLWAQALAVALSLRPIIGDLSHGNVNLLILFLVAGSLYAYRRGRDLTAGIVLALAIACKVTPALFVPYFVWKRSWRVLGGCGLGLVLFFLLIPGLLLGPVHNLELLRSWIDGMIMPYVAGAFVTTEHTNQSLPGLIYRLLTNSPSFLDGNDQPVAYHHLFVLSMDTARLIVKVCGVAFLALLCWACSGPTRQRGDWRLAAEYSIVLLGMLLFSERTWKHHCVTLVFPFTLLCYYLATQQPSTRVRVYVVGTLGAVMLLMTSTSTSVAGVFGDRYVAKLAQVYGAYTWAELLLLSALVFLLRKHRARAPARAPDYQVVFQSVTTVDRAAPGRQFDEAAATVPPGASA